MWQFFHDIGAGLKNLGLNESTATAGLLGGTALTTSGGGIDFLGTITTTSSNSASFAASDFDAGSMRVYGLK